MSENDSLSDALDQVAKDLPEVAGPHPLDIDNEQEGVQEAVQAAPAWEAPGWSKRWKEPSQKALNALYSHPEARAHLDALLPELEETYSYTGRRDQEFAQYRKMFDPIGNAIGPYVQQFQMNGMTPEAGITQTLAFADALARNPDNTFPTLAQMYKPQNAGQVIQALAQAWGADLGQVTQEQPYIDPAVQQMLGGLTQRFSTIEQALFHQHQQGQQAQQAAVLQEIQAFETATDESGAQKHPHFRTVFEDMVQLVQLGRARSVGDAYTMAVRLNPELSASIGEKQALDSAARQTAAAKQAQGASRNVSGKPNGRDTAPSSIEEAMRAADKEMAA